MMDRTGRYMLTALLLSLCLSGRAALVEPLPPEPLIVAITDNFAMPFVQHDGERVAPEGIVFDLIDELSRRLSVEARYVVLPRQRLRHAAESGLAHLFPLGNPKWYQDVQALQWSQAWLEDEDRFVVRAENVAQMQSLADMENKQVGTILGYRYPELEGRMVRQDAKSLAQNLDRLRRHRLDAVVDSVIAIRYHIRSGQGRSALALTPVVAGRSARYLGLSKQAPVSVEALSTALQSMLDDGSVENILMRYQ